ncbi:type II secretion system F family protein [Phenylobacterium sp.]|jgi:tight adherence protein B|uniref:type II secretion system F family protein n=1 Tax=Phenylobacterium sp. TaxID=1871053 RepID=UPI003783BC13
MIRLLEFVVYAAAFVAVLLAVEGIGRLARSGLGEERDVARRLGKARARARQQSATRSPSQVSEALARWFPGLKDRLDQADAPFGAAWFALAVIGVFLALFVSLSMAGAPRLLCLAAAGATAAAGPWLVLRAMIGARRRRFLHQLPQAVDLIARSLQAGHPVTTAMTVVGDRMPAPIGAEFRMVIEEMTYGLDRDEALANMLQRFPLPELRLFTASLQVTRESGGNLAEVFLKLAEAIRAKDHLRRKVHAISAEGRMSFWVVTGLPFALAAFLMLVRPSFFTDVADDPLFWPMIAFAPVSLTIGATMIWRMVNLKI